MLCMEAEQAERNAEMSIDAVWVEKYRPTSISDVVGQGHITDQISGYLERGDVPNLLFAGEAGIGKTTTAGVIARDFFGEDWNEHFMELNASDERGIDVVRDRIKDFARSSFNTSIEHRIIFLDEADSLTQDAQAALRRTMEQFSDNVRFILSCNYADQIIDPIQSRCNVCRFSSIDAESMKHRLNMIANSEGLTITEDGLGAIIKTSQGDLRRAINTLQAASYKSGDIDRDLIYTVTNAPRPEEINEMVTHAVNNNFIQAREMLDDLLNKQGMAGTEIVTQIHQQIWEFDLTDDQAITLMDEVGETDYRITEGSNERIQLESLLAKVAETK